MVSLWNHTHVITHHHISITIFFLPQTTITFISHTPMHLLLHFLPPLCELRSHDKLFMGLIISSSFFLPYYLAFPRCFSSTTHFRPCTTTMFPHSLTSQLFTSYHSDTFHLNKSNLTPLYLIPQHFLALSELTSVSS